MRMFGTFHSFLCFIRFTRVSCCLLLPLFLCCMTYFSSSSVVGLLPTKYPFICHWQSYISDGLLPIECPFICHWQCYINELHLALNFFCYSSQQILTFQFLRGKLIILQTLFITYSWYLSSFLLLFYFRL